MNATILSCAVIGAFTTREHNPNAPITPDEIATSCINAAKAGAAVVHIHVRDPKTGENSMDLTYYKDVVDQIRASDVDVLINLTTGPGGRYLPGNPQPMPMDSSTAPSTAVKRTEHVATLKPDICSLDFNTNWFGTSAIINPPSMIRDMAQIIREAGTVPELEVFDSGDIRLAIDLLDEGVLDSPAFFQIVLGIKYGFNMNPETLAYAKSQLPADAKWAAFGVSRMTFPMVAQSWLLGGHCRVGMEDTVYLSRGVLAPSNAALVAKAKGIIEELGGTIATSDEARTILGVTNS